MYVRITEGNYNLMDPSDVSCNVHVRTDDPALYANIKVDGDEGYGLRRLPWGDAVESAMEMTTYQPLLDRDVQRFAEFKDWLLEGGGVQALNRAWWDKERPKLVARLEQFDARFGATLTVA